MSGRLFIVSTPIGNLGDITPRVQDALRESSVVLAEDTRVTQKLLFHLGIKTNLISCHEFNESSRLHFLETAVSDDSALSIVSDAGTPLVSDPGFLVVRKAIEMGIKIIPIPGPSAPLAALVGSGLPTDRFAFEGFLPEKAGDREKRLAKLRDDDRTLIFFVAPSQLAVTLSEMKRLLGDRKAAIARELTKFYEEFVRGTLSELARHVEEHPIRGEYVLVVSGADSDSSRLSETDAADRVRRLLAEGARLKDVSNVLSAETGWSASELYKLGLAIKKSADPES